MSIQQNTLKIEIIKRPVLLQYKTVVARTEHGKVILFIDDKRVEMNTVLAHKIGMKIFKTITNNLAFNEIIVLIINGEKVEFDQGAAKKLAVALLRKADQADDWQLNKAN